MVKYCPSCGSEVDPNSIYCFNCGYKIPVTAYPKSKPAWEPPTQPQTTYQPPRYRAAFQPRIYHPSMKAPLTDRCVALLLDNCIDQFFCGIYGCFKDGIRDGQSLGKGVMNLRVIDYNHGIPATSPAADPGCPLPGWWPPRSVPLVGLRGRVQAAPA